MDNFEKCFFDLLREKLKKQDLSIVGKNNNDFSIANTEEICYIKNYVAYYVFINLKKNKSKAVLIKRDNIFIADNKNMNNTVPENGNGKDYSYDDAVKELINFIL